MKLAKSIATILLLLFVGATVGTLIAQEVARPEVQLAETGASEPLDETSLSTVNETSKDEPDSIIDEPGPPPVDTVDGDGVAEGTGETAVLPSSSAEEPCLIEAVYFHNTYRCVTCLKIENAAKTIVEAKFSEKLAAGTLRWSAINMEEERAYISQYELAMPSLVLIRRIGNEVVGWITLEETWSLVRSSTRFSDYIVDSFQTFLKGCP